MLGAIYLQDGVLRVDDVPTATLLKSALVMSYRSEDFFPKFNATNLLAGMLSYVSSAYPFSGV